MTKLLIDGDLFCYRSSASAENEDLSVAQYYTEKLLDDCLLTLNAASFVFFLTGENNFRFKVYPEYKANRLNTPKPRHLPAMRQWLLEKYQAQLSDGCEADDLMAIAQTAQTAREPTIIVSLDKDMLQVPGFHYSWRIEGGTPEKRWVKEALYQEITPIQGARHFYTQMLTGDTSDNIKGVAGIGKVKAAAMLANEQLEEEDMFNIVRDSYDSDEEMLMNGRCLWLQRQPDEIWQFPYATE